MAKLIDQNVAPDTSRLVASPHCLEGSMYLRNEDDGLRVLKAMGSSYPNPVHLSYLTIELGFTHGRMQRTLWDLAQAGLIIVTGGHAAQDLIHEAQISAGGMALALGMASGYDDAGHLAASLEAELLRELRRVRLRGRAKLLPAGEARPRALLTAAPVRASMAAPQRAEPAQTPS
jgi:hypothetical protein